MDSTPTGAQCHIQFDLIHTQLLVATGVCSKALNGEKQYQAACHLIGIAAYVSELAERIKAGYELRKM